MSQKPPLNPNKARVSKIRTFDGIGGAVTQVLKRTNERGNDISNSIANEVQDFDLGEKGSLILRDGKRKIDETGKDYDITSIFDLNIGGLLQYGLVFNGNLDLIEIPLPDTDAPDFAPPPLELTPEKPDKPSDFPTDWPWPDDVVSDYMYADPSLPPEGQVCESSYTIVDSPATLSFTMELGGSNPAAQNWWFKVEGRWLSSLEATFSSSASWYNVSTVGVWSFVTGPCTAVGINQVTIQVDGSALSAGTVTDILTLTWSDGTILDVGITFIVTPVVTLTVSGIYRKEGNEASFAAAITAMQVDVPFVRSNSVLVAASTVFKVAQSGANRYNTSAYNGLSFTKITLTIGPIGSYTGQIGVIALQAQASGTISADWTWWTGTGGVTGTLGNGTEGLLEVTLSSAIVLDDWLFLTYTFSPFAAVAASMRTGEYTIILS